MAEPLKPQKVEPDDTPAEAVGKSLGCAVVLAILSTLGTLIVLIF